LCHRDKIPETHGGLSIVLAKGLKGVQFYSREDTKYYIYRKLDYLTYLPTEIYVSKKTFIKTVALFCCKVNSENTIA